MIDHDGINDFSDIGGKVADVVSIIERFADLNDDFLVKVFPVEADLVEVKAVQSDDDISRKIFDNLFDTIFPGFHIPPNDRSLSS
jgi:hypothetical protein